MDAETKCDEEQRQAHNEKKARPTHQDLSDCRTWCTIKNHKSEEKACVSEFQNRGRRGGGRLRQEDGRKQAAEG